MKYLWMFKFNFISVTFATRLMIANVIFHVMIVKRHFLPCIYEYTCNNLLQLKHVMSVRTQFCTMCVWKCIHYACMWWVIKHIFAQWLCEYAYNLNNLRNIFRQLLCSLLGLFQVKKNMVEEFYCIYIFYNNKLKQFCL